MRLPRHPTAVGFLAMTVFGEFRNPQFQVLVAWQTRNVRREVRALNYCKDYGLRPIHKTLHIGMLYKKEHQQLQEKLSLLLNKKQDKLFSVIMCQSCAQSITARNCSLAELREFAPYEIVQTPKNP